MVILFDGVCNLCNGFVQFIIKRDKNEVFQFASLQSKYGQALCTHFNIATTTPETVVLFDGNTVFTESTAAIKIIASLNGAWKATVIFKIIPLFMRNAIYRLIAKNRYKWLGQRNECMVPTEDLKARFLDNTPFIL